MRSEHRLSGTEEDAFSRVSRRLLRWGRGELRAVKRRAHKADRRAARARAREER